MIKKLFLVIFLAFTLFLPLAANAESVNSFTSVINIKPDSSIVVEEIIYYDFGPEPKHGIFRDIPYRYNARGGNYNLKINVLSVTDESGSFYKFDFTKSNGQYHIKIGDANYTVTGKHTYIITYSVLGAINYFKDHDELYWNVTGNEWKVPIISNSAQIDLPSTVSNQSLQISCFAGELGSTRPCSSAEFDNKLKDQTQRIFYNNLSLNPGQGFTIVAGFPKGLVDKPTFFEKLTKIITDNQIVVIPILVFLAMLILWLKKGRDPLGFKTVIPQYEPPENISPCETGTILDKSADTKDLSAEIIQLAILGYIKITKITKKVLLFNIIDYELERLPGIKLLTNIQQQLLRDLFESNQKVNISDLKNKFYTHIKPLQDSIYGNLVTNGYFAKNPAKVRAVYKFTGITIMFLCGFIGFKVLDYAYFWFSLAVSGLIIFIFGKFMPAKTPKGAQAKQSILGLKMYLSVAEKDRINFFNAPEKTPGQFEKFLPFALVLGVEEKWAKQFEDIYTTPPSWYSDASGGHFNSLYFISNIRNFSDTANQSLYSKPSGAGSGGSGLGGGGFSGGGFGGGGGGSW